MSSAAGMASACPPPSYVMTRQTVMMLVTRPPAHPSPAAQHPSSATTAFASHACGPATVTQTALMARMSCLRTVVHRNLVLPPPTGAHLWSSTVAAESASTATGGVMEEPIALIDLMKLTVVNMSYNSSFPVNYLLSQFQVSISGTLINFYLLHPSSSSYLPS